jgi:hypothetical protein
MEAPDVGANGRKVSGHAKTLSKQMWGALTRNQASCPLNRLVINPGGNNAATSCSLLCAVARGQFQCEGQRRIHYRI